MKIVQKVCSYIFTIIFALSILGLILINIVSSKVMNENYVISKLEEEDYYSKVYDDVKSNFENYIYQSGLNEDVFNDLVSKEKIKEDTKIILDNIYNGSENNIDTSSISEKLNQNINQFLGGNISNSQKKNIDEFVKKICEEYKNTISNTKYKSKINSVYNLMSKYIEVCKKILYITASVSFVFIILLNIKKIYQVLGYIGVAAVIDGLILIITKNYIFSKVYIYGITIMSEAVSIVLRLIITEIFDKIFQYGFLLLSSGTLLVIAYGLIRAIGKYKKEKEQYTPEN